MEMSLCHAELPGLGRLVALWLEAVVCSAPLQRSRVPLVHFISPQGLCKKRHAGRINPFPPSYRMMFLPNSPFWELQPEETMYMCCFFVLHQQLKLQTNNILHDCSKTDSAAYWMSLHLAIYVQCQPSLSMQEVVCPLCVEMESEGGDWT